MGRPATAAYPRQGSTTAGVVDDLADRALDVVVALSIVKHTVLGSTLAVGVVGAENGPATLTLGPNDTTHLRAHTAEKKRVALSAQLLLPGCLLIVAMMFLMLTALLAAFLLLTISKRAAGTVARRAE